MTAEQQAILEKMDKAADQARAELVELVAKFPDAAEAFGEWAAKHKPTAGYKRIGQLIVALG